MLKKVTLALSVLSITAFTQSANSATLEEIRATDMSSTGYYADVVALSTKALIVSNPYGTDKSVFVYVDTDGDNLFSDEVEHSIEPFDYVKGASAGLIGGGFGLKLAASGNTLAVSAKSDSLETGYGYIPESPRNSGAVYVYVDRDGDGDFSDETAQKIKAATPTTNQYFGTSVAISGNTLVVGTLDDDVFVFVDDNYDGYFTDEVGQLLPAPNGNGPSAHNFTEVAVSGNTIAIGGSNLSVNDSVYLYVDSNNDGQFIEAQQLLNASVENRYANDGFGRTLSISDNKVVVGAGYSDEFYSYTGSAHVFVDHNKDGIFSETPEKLNGLNPRSSDSFGKEVTIQGNTLLIANYQDDESNHNGGTVYLYRDTNGNGLFGDETPLYITNAELTSAGDYDYFGGSIVIRGDVVAVGTRSSHYNDGGKRGSAYTFSTAPALVNFN
jgi:hypothetical protein